MSARGVVFEYIQYLHSLLCRAVDQWLCSVSVLHSEIFTGWRCYQQTVQKLICLSDLKWCCFSMFISSYSYVLFRCVNRHFPLSLSNCKPKYCKVITLLSLYPLICYPSKYSRVIIFSAVSFTSTSELADFQWMHLLLAPLVSTNIPLLQCITRNMHFYWLDQVYLHIVHDYRITFRLHDHHCSLVACQIVIQDIWVGLGRVMSRQMSSSAKPCSVSLLVQSSLFYWSGDFVRFIYDGK